MKKTAIMGGTFDPIHQGHLIIAEHVYNTGLFDDILFIPNGQPPHKEGIQLMDGRTRLELCNLAIEGNDHFRSSDIELRQTERCYTLDTVNALKMVEEDTEFTMIIGSDTVVQLETWHEPEELLSNVGFIVVDRSTETSEETQAEIQRLKEKYPSSNISYLPMPLIEISSSEIRRLWSLGNSARYLLPEKVRTYILEHGLNKG